MRRFKSLPVHAIKTPGSIKHGVKGVAQTRGSLINYQLLPAMCSNRPSICLHSRIIKSSIPPLPPFAYRLIKTRSPATWDKSEWWKPLRSAIITIYNMIHHKTTISTWKRTNSSLMNNNGHKIPKSD